MSKEVRIVGAGLAGATCARLFLDRGWKVTVFEQESQPGGLCRTGITKGIVTHLYGAHILNTDDEWVWAFLNYHTKVWETRHTKVVSCKGFYYPYPVNLLTLNMLYGVKTVPEAEAFLRSKERQKSLRTFFNAPYDKKMWGTPRISYAERIHSYADFEIGYHSTKHSGIIDSPRLFHGLLKGAKVVHKRATLRDMKGPTVFTGDVAELFDRRDGPIPYRTLSIRWKTYPWRRHYGISVVNWLDPEVTHLRSVEHRYLMPACDTPYTVVSYETPIPRKGVGKPMYPVPDGVQKWKNYVDRLKFRAPNVRLAGRIAKYQYWDMDDVILDARTLVDEMTGTRRVSEEILDRTVHGGASGKRSFLYDMDPDPRARGRRVGDIPVGPPRVS